MIFTVASLAAIIANMVGYWIGAKVGSRWLAGTGRFGLTAVNIVIIVFLLVRAPSGEIGRQS